MTETRGRGVLQRQRSSPTNQPTNPVYRSDWSIPTPAIAYGASGRSLWGSWLGQPSTNRSVVLVFSLPARVSPLTSNLRAHSEGHVRIGTLCPAIFSYPRPPPLDPNLFISPPQGGFCPFITGPGSWQTWWVAIHVCSHGSVEFLVANIHPSKSGRCTQHSSAPGRAQPTWLTLYLATLPPSPSLTATPTSPSSHPTGPLAFTVLVQCPRTKICTSLPEHRNRSFR